MIWEVGNALVRFMLRSYRSLQALRTEQKYVVSLLLFFIRDMQFLSLL